MQDSTGFALDPALYAPVSPEDPAGPDLRRDDAWHELRQACVGRPGRYDPIEGKELPAQPPNWSRALPLARAFVGRSKDVQALALLAQAELAVNGLPGLAAALDLLHATLRDHWADCHPRADEDGDYWERAAALRALNGPAALARPVETAPIHVSPAAGPVTWRTLAAAAGDARARDGEIALSAESVRSMIASEPGAADAFARTHAAAEEAAAALAAIEGIEGPPDGWEPVALTEPAAALRRVARTLAPYLDSVAPTREEAAPDAAASPGPGDAESEAGPPGTAAPGLPGEIADRDEAVALMNEIVAYYGRSARSSPVPFIVIRVRDLLDKSFHQVLEEVAPGSWDEASLKLAGMGPDLLGAPPPGAAPPPEKVVAAAARIEAAAEALVAAAAPDAEGGEAAGEAADLAPLADELRAALTELRALTAPADEAESAPPRIRDRSDVKEALDRLARHFEKTDPNSLAPAFLRRARPLVDQSFLDIVKELAPQGASTAKLLLHRG